MSPEVKDMTSNKGGFSGALKGMEPGDARKGFLPGGNITRLPDYVPEEEVLSKEEAERKTLIQKLLLKWVVPNELSSRSNENLDRKSMASKFQKNTLAELMRFLPDWFVDVSNEKLQAYLEGDEILSDEDKAEIQDKYKDISP